MSTSLTSRSQPSEHRRAAPVPCRAAVDVDIVIPVHNEQVTLERSIRRLHGFLTAETRFAWRIVIADNASTDATPAITRFRRDVLDELLADTRDQGWFFDTELLVAAERRRGEARSGARPRAAGSIARTGPAEPRR